MLLDLCGDFVTHVSAALELTESARRDREMRGKRQLNAFGRNAQSQLLLGELKQLTFGQRCSISKIRAAAR